MDEYIKRKPLIEEISSLSVTLCGNEIFGTLAKHSVVKTIYEQPAADVVDVRHGEWIGKPIAGMCTVRCSACGMAFSENSGRWLYCPNCGAKMDGKRKDGAE